MNKIRSERISKINSIWDSEKPLSIIEVANEAIGMIYALMEINNLFKKFIFIGKNGEKVYYDSSQLDKDKITLGLANNILNENQADIKLHEKVVDPNLDYQRDFGFTFLLNFQIADKTAFSYSPKLGAKGRNSHVLAYFQRGFNIDYHMCIKIFKQLITNTKSDPIYGCVGLFNLDLSRTLKKRLKLIYTLEIAGYFGSELKFLSDKLDKVELEIDNRGVFILPIDPNFMKSKESLKSEIQKLIKLNSLIAIEGNIRK